MPDTMFERYGGFANVSKVVMAFYDKAIDSDIIGEYFDHIDMPALIDHQTKFISSIMGGPASYTNDQLARVHAHLAIDNAAMDEMMALLRETLEDFEFQASDIDQILNEVRSRSGHIVTA